MPTTNVEPSSSTPPTPLAAGPEQWDNDLRRQRVLERLGWSFWRVRAPAYYLDREAAMATLWDRLEKMHARALEAPALPERGQRDRPGDDRR